MGVKVGWTIHLLGLALRAELYHTSYMDQPKVRVVAGKAKTSSRKIVQHGLVADEWADARNESIPKAARPGRVQRPAAFQSKDRVVRHRLGDHTNSCHGIYFVAFFRKIEWCRDIR